MKKNFLDIYANSQITWEICEEKFLKIWGEKRKLLAGSSECSTSWWGNSTFSRNFVESLLKNPPWLHNDIRMFNTLWKSEIGKFIFRLVTKWHTPLECYISPIKNVCPINIQNGIDFPEHSHVIIRYLLQFTTRCRDWEFLTASKRTKLWWMSNKCQVNVRNVVTKKRTMLDACWTNIGQLIRNMQLLCE